MRSGLAAAWAAELRDGGHVEVGVLSEPRLLAAGVTSIQATAEERRVVETSFERLDASDQAQAIEQAPTDGSDPELVALATGVMSHPTASGTWMMTPPWFEPLSSSAFFRLSGMALPDGSAGMLEAVVEPATSRFRFTVRTLPDQAARLAAHFFMSDPTAPADAEPGWTDDHGGGLAQLTNVWPKGRGTRAVTWRVTRTSSASPTAFLQARQDFGVKRSSDDTVDEAELAARLQAMLEQATAEGSRQR